MTKEINNKQNVQIARLEENQKIQAKKLDALEEKIDEIITNHLFHIGQDMSRLNTNQKQLLWFMGAIVMALIGLWIK